MLREVKRTTTRVLATLFLLTRSPPLLALALQPFVESVLLPHGMVVDRVEKLASDIRATYPDSTPHLLVVLKGGSEFAVDLTRTLRKLHSYREGKHLPFTVDYVRVKSYEGTESTGTGERASFGLWALRCAAGPCQGEEHTQARAAGSAGVLSAPSACCAALDGRNGSLSLTHSILSVRFAHHP